jgi:hypothetical protein
VAGWPTAITRTDEPSDVPWIQARKTAAWNGAAVSADQPPGRPGWPTALVLAATVEAPALLQRVPQSAGWLGASVAAADAPPGRLTGAYGLELYRLAEQGAPQRSPQSAGWLGAWDAPPVRGPTWLVHLAPYLVTEIPPPEQRLRLDAGWLGGTAPAADAPPVRSAAWLAQLVPYRVDAPLPIQRVVQGAAIGVAAAARGHLAMSDRLAAQVFLSDQGVTLVALSDRLGGHLGGEDS